jgi:septal ring factor EnvC (AmiA/AmiB activator)
MVVGVMQISSLQRKLDQERKSLNSQVHDLERKLEMLRQELAVAESALSAKDSELAMLKNNLKELEDLREMKEVLTRYIYRFNIFALFVLSKNNFIYQFLYGLCRTLTERMNKQLPY